MSDRAVNILMAWLLLFIVSGSIAICMIVVEPSKCSTTIQVDKTTTCYFGCYLATAGATSAQYRLDKCVVDLCGAIVITQCKP